MTESKPKTGSCSCGDVQFEIHCDEPLQMYICHCINCRKATGSVFASQNWFPRDALKFTSGQDKITRWAKREGQPGEEPMAASHFCGTCHSFLYFAAEYQGMKDIYIVPLGALDDVSYFRPQKEFFMKRRCGWLTEIEGAEQRQELKS